MLPYCKKTASTSPIPTSVKREIKKCLVNYFIMTSFVAQCWKKILLDSFIITGVFLIFFSWLVRSSPDRTVRVQGPAWDIVLCSRARHFTLTVPLSTQVYKWVPANLMLGVRCDGLAFYPGNRNTLTTSCYRNRR